MLYSYYLSIFKKISTCHSAIQSQTRAPLVISSKFSLVLLMRHCKEQLHNKDHLHKAENFYSSLRISTSLAKGDSRIATITFDIAQNLPLPSVPAGEVFYMHQLWLYIFGVHNCSDNTAQMDCWPEKVAGRGSDEVISCLSHLV